MRDLRRTSVPPPVKWQQRVLRQEILVWQPRVKERRRALSSRPLWKRGEMRGDDSGYTQGGGKAGAAERRRGGKTCGGQAAGPLQGRPLWLRSPDRCGKEWIMRLDYRPWDGVLFRIDPPGNRRWCEQKTPAWASQSICVNTLIFSVLQPLVHVSEDDELPSCFRYGFGLLDAGLMVQQAARFHRLASQRECTEEFILNPIR